METGSSIEKFFPDRSKFKVAVIKNFKALVAEIDKRFPRPKQTRIGLAA